MARKKTFGTRTQLSTFGTDLGGIVRFDSNSFNSFSFSFILDETLQLIEAPITNPIIHSSSKISSSNSFEIFHNNFISIELGNNFLADVMINPSHEPLLFSRYFFKQSSGTSSAFTLEFATQEFEFPFDLFDFKGFEELIIRSDSEVVYSEINTKNSILDVRASNIDFFGKTEQKETSSFSINSQEAFSNLPIIEIFPITIRNINIEFLPSFDCENTQDIIFEGSRTGEIISDRRIMDYRFSFSPFNHSTRLLNTSNRQLAFKSSLTKVFIDKWMELDIIVDSSLPSLINAELQTFTINFDSSCYFICRNDFNLSCGSNIHTFNNYLNYINLTEDVSPPTNELVGVRNTNIL